jgi:very-short-patch-repair endonuclease
VTVYDEHGDFVARVDLAWPSLGIFIELDGQQHLDQPVYDASRQTAVISATGWLVGRFTWYEVNYAASTCRRRLLGLLAQANRRPVIVP